MVITKKGSAVAERQIVTALIVSDQFIKEMCQIIDTTLLKSRFARYVANWCLEYFNTYEKAPNRTIQDIYEARAADLDEKTAEAIEIFLESISKEFEKVETFNYPYYKKQAETYIREQNLKRLLDESQSDLLQGNIDAVESRIAEFDQIKLVETSGIDLFKDHDKIRYILDNRTEDVIFRFNGVLGDIINESCRGELIALSGPEKRGKSWWLQEIGMLSVLNGFNVAHFSLEMTEQQMIYRQAQYLTGSPSKPDDLKCEIPYLTASGRVRYRKSTKPVLTSAIAEKKIRSLLPMVRGASLKLVCWPPSSKTIMDVKAQLDLWERTEGFVADAIVVDHADRLAPRRANIEVRHGIDSIWEDLKGLALERYCLVATATHSKLITASKRITQATASAEDKRKSGHVDRMIGLNQTDEEKMKGLMRLNVLYERNNDGKSHLDVAVLQCLAIGRPYLGSYIQQRDLPKEEK